MSTARRSRPSRRTPHNVSPTKKNTLAESRREKCGHPYGRDVSATRVMARIDPPEAGIATSSSASSFRVGIACGPSRAGPMIRHDARIKMSVSPAGVYTSLS